MVDKCLLERIQSVFRGQTLNSGDLPSLTLAGQDQTGVYSPSIHKNGAGAALADSATFLGAGKMKIIPKEIEEAEIGIDFE